MKIWLASTMIVSVRPILFFRSKATQYPFRKEDDSEINHGGRGRDFFTRAHRDYVPLSV